MTQTQSPHPGDRPHNEPENDDPLTDLLKAMRPLPESENRVTTLVEAFTAPDFDDDTPITTFKAFLEDIADVLDEYDRIADSITGTTNFSTSNDAQQAVRAVAAALTPEQDADLWAMIPDELKDPS